MYGNMVEKVVEKKLYRSNDTGAFVNIRWYPYNMYTRINQLFRNCNTNGYRHDPT